MNQSAVDLLLFAERRGGSLLPSDILGPCSDRSCPQVHAELLKNPTLAECLDAAVLRIVVAGREIEIRITPTGEDYLDAMRAPDAE